MNSYLARCAISAMLLVLSASLSYAAPLPPNRTLTIQLSAVDYSGQITPVDSTTIRTDARGKFTFSFPVVPSIDRAQYLYLQVFDGTNLLRQSLVPAPDSGATVDAGISEISDLQTRALLNAKAGSNNGLTPFHMVAALTMLRSQAISQDDVNKIVTAVNAAANAFYAALYASSQSVTNSSSALMAPAASVVQGAYSSRTIVTPTKLRVLNPITGVPPSSPPAIITGSLTTEQVAIFNKELLAGLRRSMSLFRKSVDDATASDIKVEAVGRSAAMALLIKELVAASASAGIPLEATEWAYMFAAAAAESSLTQQNASPVVVSLVRLCFVNGMTLYQAARIVRSHLDALATLGISSPNFQRYFFYLSSISENISKYMRIDSMLAEPTLSDAHTYEMTIFNSFASRDLIYFKTGMQAFFSYFETGIDIEYENLLAIVISRMAASSGVMTGMTEAKMQAIMGTTYQPIVYFQLPVWLYLQQIPQYTYAPIVGLSNGVNSIPSPPLIDQFSGAYLAQAQMDYDLALILELYLQDNRAAQNAVPAQWYSFATAANLKKKVITRRANVQARMSGLTANEADAIMTISRGTGGNDFY